MQDAATLIVIPCLNEERHLPLLLAGLIADPTPARIVVADGGSSDNSRNVVAAFAARDVRVTLLDNPARIQSAALNLAARQFGEGVRWLIRVDAHGDYPPDYAARLVRAAERQQADAVVVPMVSRGRGCFQRGAAAAQNSVLGTGGSPHRHVGEGRYVDHGHHALIDLASFLAVGGYDQRLSHNEDAELDTRLRQRGARIWLEPGAAIVYYPRARPGALFRQYWSYGRGRAMTRAIHREPLHLRQIVPLAVPAASVLALASPLFPAAVLPLTGWLAVCLLVGAVAMDDEKSPCARLSGVAAIIMHFAWGWGFVVQSLAGGWLTPRLRDGPCEAEPRESDDERSVSAPSAISPAGR